LITIDTSHLARTVKAIIGHRHQIAQTIEKIVNIVQHDALLVSNSADIAAADAVSFKQAQDLLGQEKKLVIIDLFDEIAVDAIAAVAGIVPGGGCLVFCLPPRDQWQTVYHSFFARRFLTAMQANKALQFIDSTDAAQLNAMTESLMAVQTTSEMSLTADQLTVIENIKQLSQSQQRQSLVVVSDRGRGKSSALGVAAAELLQNKKIRILITAPRFKACEMAFVHARRILSGDRVKQACLRYAESELRFMAPDEILHSDYAADILLIDEAASIPLPQLKSLLLRYQRTVFSSTVHGYEGTGRGFSVRFAKVLDASVWRWQKIEMKTPVRWAAGDGLEQWLFKLLCLDVELSELAADIELGRLNIRQLEQQQLSADEALLRQVFALLVLAHYRTRPSDLQRILDQNLSITVAEIDNTVVAVLLSADEGGFEPSMAAAIYQGQRRARGHLLAQTLSYHCGVESAACARSHRIMRIVVHPDCQSRGVGRQLLGYLVERLQNNAVDLLGASFGLTQALASFWQQNQFELVRIGLKHEKSSGERAAVFVRPLTEKGRQIHAKARQRFSAHLPLLRHTVLRDVEPCYQADNGSAQSSQLSPLELEDISSFIHYSKAYELCIAGVNKWLNNHIESLKSIEAHDQYFKVVDSIVFRQHSWQTTVEIMQLAGKKQARALFKEAVSWYWQKLSH